MHTPRCEFSSLPVGAIFMKDGKKYEKISDRLAAEFNFEADGSSALRTTLMQSDECVQIVEADDDSGS